MFYGISSRVEQLSIAPQERDKPYLVQICIALVESEQPDIGNIADDVLGKITKQNSFFANRENVGHGLVDRVRIAEDSVRQAILKAALPDITYLICAD